MKKLLTLIAFAVATLTSPAFAQAYNPSVRISDTNPPPTKILCWNGSAYAACSSGDASAANQTATQADAGADAAKATSVQGITGGKAIPISAASLPLPSGAATAAKQPALGTAGTASADVLSVQGIASGTPLIVGGLVANDVAASGNPVLTAARYITGTPGVITSGNIRTLALDARGNLRVIMNATSSTPNDSGTSAGFVISSGSEGSAGPLGTLGYVWNGTNAIIMRGDTSGTVTQPYALAASRWGYAAASGGITNTTTAVTVAAAAGGALRNYATSMQCDSDALGAATELALRDGAGGTVLWRGGISTSGWLQGRDIVFPVPLKGTANTLLEIVTLTASVTGSVRCNLQGFTAL